jgi:large subunit ribosomal protein L25
MEKVKIQANIRAKAGKETAKKERRAGSVPAIVYGKKGENLTVTVPTPSIKILRGIHFSRSAIIELELAGKSAAENLSVLIKDIQYHPLTEEVIHFDFMKVSLTDKIRVSVPIVLKGEAKGVKEEGIVEQIMWNLEIEGLPMDIPEKVEVDVTPLAIGDSIHVGEVKIADNLRMITHADGTIVTVVEKAEEEVAAPTAAEAAPTGPEVIKEKKETEEGEKAEEGKPAAGAKEAAAAPEKGKEKAPEKGKGK